MLRELRENTVDMNRKSKPLKKNLLKNIKKGEIMEI